MYQPPADWKILFHSFCPIPLIPLTEQVCQLASAICWVPHPFWGGWNDPSEIEENPAPADHTPDWQICVAPKAGILGKPRIPAGASPDNAGRLLLASMRSQNQAFGKALRSLRKARKVTQRDLAVHARLDRSYVSAMELGENSPTLDTLLALCRGLDISLVDMSVAIERELASNH
ncbi:helix-turn-helix transcriptional regulator [Burkholderia cepacia]|uniref:helix-turn-helix domain-containing protein n=1 Tax=Burkholderia cepacia TaxID=292 RepID=UPI002655FD91|nr:helix-turn-helix transcriptional regulator [Burkholderia cepacia]MDN7444761.1 helix-turn-helix transcriptional regulator [Burkholderia cepacia]